ncbi:coiled-coil domain-containing protein 166 isoform X2 [Vidua chalybeata]|uniref:coiled-coil domain-containing protein 166 isoform X2 n=1 Tax=Vidua chalybeata TaxID=81927 RepID=UPI0023A8E9EF|nr:coiled-coil domain-containing protein 166 isoform X2 [Vidua chalybeata]
MQSSMLPCELASQEKLKVCRTSWVTFRSCTASCQTRLTLDPCRGTWAGWAGGMGSTGSTGQVGWDPWDPWARVRGVRSAWPSAASCPGSQQPLEGSRLRTVAGNLGKALGVLLTELAREWDPPGASLGIRSCCGTWLGVGSPCSPPPVTSARLLGHSSNTRAPGPAAHRERWEQGKPGSREVLQLGWDMATKTKNSKDEAAPQETSDTEDPVRERKLHLQEECRVLTQHLDTYLGRAEQLLQGSKRLEREAQGTREQSQSYLRCGAKLSQDPPGMVITLNDRNRQDLAQIQAQQQELVPRYAGKEQQVRSALKDTEAEASRLDAELQQLQPYRERKVQAEQKVKALEKELRVTRIRCAEETHAVRSRFLQDKADCEQEFHQRMQQLTWGAQELALQALIQHVEQVKAENRLLRHELLGLLQHCQLLRDARIQLQDQQEQLLRESRCAQQAALPAAARRRGDSLPCSPVRAGH